APADDGRLLQRPLLLGGQQVDPGEENGLDVIGDLDVGDSLAGVPLAVLVDELPLVDQLPDDLLEEERVALRALQDPLPEVARKIIGREQGADELAAPLPRQRVERKGGEVPAAAGPVR